MKTTIDYRQSLKAGKRQLLIWVFLITAIVSAASRTGAETPFPCETHAPTHANADSFIRTELFFGTARENLPSITDHDWHMFLKSEITERFPEGLTVLRADGQFRDSSGNVINENSFVVVLLYPLDQWMTSNARIEEIRRLYKTAFKQQSVLRVDSPLPVRVSF